MTVQVSRLDVAEFDRVGGRRTGVPAADDEPGAGALGTARGNLPLAALDVRADLVGLTAHTVLRQTFHNPYDEPLEATYVFPLPPRAAVTGMRMLADDREVVAELRERGEARQRYEQAVEAGQRASIAEQERPDVFTMRVGNIVPGERVVVELTMDGLLPYADDAATYRFPLVVAPRYIPGAPLPGGSVGDGTVPDTDAVPDASRITPPVLLPGFPNPIDLSVSVHVDPAGLPLTEVRSSLHAVDTEHAGDGLRLAIRPGERADRDLILRLDYAADAVATAASSTPDDAADDRYGTGTLRLTLLPPADTGPARPRDLVLLLDRSGSMNGWKMVAARRAAARIVDTLTDTDRFSVLLFDHVVEHVAGLPEGLVAATDRHRYAAVEQLARTDARGGTELLRPMTEALSLLSDPDRDLVLVLVTDGQVGNEDQIVAACADRLDAVRVHTVGIDRAVNAGFLGRLAALGGGRCELVESEDRLDTAMTAIHRRIGAPVLRDLRLEADGVRLVPDSLTPARLPDLFPGAPVVLTGRVADLADAARVRVHARRPDGSPWSTEVAVSVADDPAAAAIWAKGRLRDLEDGYAAGGDDRPALESTIVDTSLRFGVLCRFTAFVAVDTRVVAEGGSKRRVTQPVELPSGWEPPAPPGPPAPAGGAGGMVPMAMRMSTRAAPLSGGPGVAAPTFAGAGVAPRRRRRTDPVVQARTQVGVELRRLRDAGPDTDRLAVLADLGTRLAVLVDALPDGAAGRSELAALVPALRACDGAEPPRGADLDRLWARTVEVLAGFAGDAEGGDGRSDSGSPGRGGSGPRRRSGRRDSFWR